MGRYLRTNYSLDSWHEALQRLRAGKALQRGKENGLLWTRLRICYEDLVEDEQHLFLDIACFFSEGSIHRSTVERVWRLLGLQNLIDRSLVRVKENGFLHMHDQLRDMGRKIVKDLAGKSLGRVIRLWDAKEAKAFFQDIKVATSLEGMSLAGCGDMPWLSVTEFWELQQKRSQRKKNKQKWFPNLRLLNLSSTQPNIVPFYSRLRAGKALEGGKENKFHTVTPPSSSSEEVMEDPGCSSSREEMEDQRCLLPKHRIFLSHSGAQKPFVERLCEDLEGRNYSPFFDQNSDSLPKGEKFAPMILQAAKQCLVAVIVLSKEYMTSKWPMLELSAFLEAENPKLKILPLFYKLLPEDLKDMNSWMEEGEQMAELDRTIDTELWMKAVKTLRSFNGMIFNLSGKSEKSYRSDVVREICKLSPSAPWFDTSNVQGKDRLCEDVKEMASMFENVVDINNQGTQYLGLYGMGGLGKTTMCQALCNHFHSEFSGRVCHVALGSGNPVAQQKLAVRKLTGLREEDLQTITDASEGRQLLKDRLPGNQPVFLALDNVEDSDSSREEGIAYLQLSLCKGSKVLITSRSRDILEEILKHPKYCKPIPDLEMEEARGLLLSMAAPGRAVSSFPHEEQQVLRRCVDKCNFYTGDSSLSNQEIRQYHPLALRALGAYLRTKEITSWEARLDNFKLSSTVFYVLGLGYKSLSATSQLIFLDVALFDPRTCFSSGIMPQTSYRDTVSWLMMAHGENRRDIKDELEGLQRKTFLNEWDDDVKWFKFHDLYVEFARWLVVVDNEAKELFLYKGEDGVAEPEKFRFSSASNRLRRVSLSGASFAGCGPTKVYEWCNVVILHLDRCDHLRELDLRGLNCLCSLKLESCRDLEYVRCSCNPLEDMSGPDRKTSRPIMECIPQLQDVKLASMSSLQQIPQCWNLRWVEIAFCEGLKTFPSFRSCSRLEQLRINWTSDQPSTRNLDLENHTLLTNVQIHENAKSGKTNLKGLSSLTNLQQLSLRCVFSTELTGLKIPTGVDDLWLEWLHLDPVVNFSALKNLKDLYIADCVELQSLDVRGLTGLTNLSLLWNSNMTGIQGLDQLSQLRRLFLSYCSSFVLDGFDFGQLHHLTILDLEGANIHEVQGLDKLSQLYWLNLDHCKKLSKLPGWTPPDWSHQNPQVDSG